MHDSVCMRYRWRQEGIVYASMLIHLTTTERANTSYEERGLWRSIRRRSGGGRRCRDEGCRHAGMWNSTNSVSQLLTFDVNGLTRVSKRGAIFRETNQDVVLNGFWGQRIYRQKGCDFVSFLFLRSVIGQNHCKPKIQKSTL